jgi:hypothetical protein
VWQQNWSLSILCVFLSAIYAVKSGKLAEVLAAGSEENCKSVLAQVEPSYGTAAITGGETDDYSVENAFDKAWEDSGGLVVVLVYAASETYATWLNLLSCTCSSPSKHGTFLHT